MRVFLSFAVPFLVFVLGECSKQVVFQINKQKYLANHVFETKQAEFEFECGLLCARHESCASINYKTSGEDKGRCELNNKTVKARTDYDEETNHEFNHLVIIKHAKIDEEKRKREILNSATSCAYLYNEGIRQDGVYTINPDGQGSFQVRCDMSTDGGGWTMFQRRKDGSQDFYLGWSDYKAGFGNLSGEFWLGLDKIHRLTKSGQNVLRVDLMDFNGTKRYAKYGKFCVADDSDKYRLNISHYSGTASDSLLWHNGMKFSTNDSDNDVRPDKNFASMFKGAWWYNNGHQSNLNGLYLGAGETYNSGIKWNKWHNRSMKMTEMKIRPSQF
ncbi:ficolin-1-like [Dendronephthya gigantea]|uniref:ficolin-1-like n=1 Tax=Dendronephthya gigantea TaxID=151771 RepID=UPI001069CBCE|nr:ficolin-1-like [Dendronephthya gigantea]